MCFNFIGCEEFLEGIKRLSPVLGFEIGSGITVEAKKADRIGVSCSGGKAIILYKEKFHFFRYLGVLVEELKRSDTLSVYEDSFFETVGVMIDTSRCAVPTVKSLSKLFDYLALFGYSTVFLYTEDTVELEGRPYFGYMRGRYTESELRAIDDYAYAYGIEVVPCLECYGHMEKYLMWPEAYPIRDTASVMMAREEKTFEFVEALIAKVSSCFRSRRVHIGMDEAWDMGRGKFLDKHGYVPPFQIFTEYMERLVEITSKYGLTPLMWSDMYFRIASDSHSYYDECVDVPEEVKEKIPKEVELVFWHYGEKHECDNYMMKKHNELGRRVWFAGGLWGWIGHFPEHNYALSTTKYSLEACRNNSVTNMMTTIWTNDNAECDTFANLFGLCFTAELVYDKGAKEDKFRRRFEAVTGGSYDAFYTMSLYHNKFDGREFASYSRRFLGKPLFWQDIMEGLFDTHLFAYPMSGHYRECADKMKCAPSDKWSYLYELAYRIFDYLAVKCEIAEKLVPSYKNGDKATLGRISGELLPLLREKTDAVHTAHKAAWFASNKIIGWANLDVRYGGVKARCDTAKQLIDAYLAGELDAIDELDEERLEKGLSGFAQYNSLVTPNLKI